MRKKALRHPESDGHIVCPFCETSIDRASSTSWCLGCGSQRDNDDNGDVFFDSERKADRQTLDGAGRQDAGNAAQGLTGSGRRRPVRLGKKRRSGR